MEWKTFTAMTINPQAGQADVSPVPERCQQLMVSDTTPWEELETELQRIESGRCLLCARSTGSDSLICERCVPRERTELS